MILLKLYLVFFKFGLLCFGGGYMLIPFLAADFVGEGKPLTPEEFANLVSVAQVTPGPIGINTATYVGFLQGKLIGATLATIGMVTPTLLLVVLASKLLKNYADSKPVKGFLSGMRPASFGLILAAVLIFAELSIFPEAIPWLRWHDMAACLIHINLPALAIAAMALCLQLKTKISFVWLVFAGAALGALFC